MKLSLSAGNLITLFISSYTLVDGFTSIFVPVHQNKPICCFRAVRPLSFSSEPSDTTNDYWEDQIVDVESQDVEANADDEDDAADAANILDLIPTAFTADVNAETRSAINEALFQLEKLNPTKEAAVSPLLNGVWELRYAGGYSPEGAVSSPTRQLALFLYSGGYSPALFVLSTLRTFFPSSFVDVQNVDLTIRRSQPRVEALAKFTVGGNTGFSGTVKVISRLETKSPIRLKETYESAAIQDFDAVEIPYFLQYSRDIYITYVDEDLLVVRDDSGVPEVLVRKEKVFPRDHGPEPSDVDDMGPPM